MDDSLIKLAKAVMPDLDMGDLVIRDRGDLGVDIDSKFGQDHSFVNAMGANKLGEWLIARKHARRHESFEQLIRRKQAAFVTPPGDMDRMRRASESPTLMELFRSNPERFNQHVVKPNEMSNMARALIRGNIPARRQRPASDEEVQQALLGGK